MAKPEIRLKGFKGEWEKLSFSEMVNRVATSGDTKTMPGVEFEDIISGEGVLNKDINNKKINKVGKCFEPGDVLFGKLRPYLKNILLADFKGVAIGDFWVLRPNNINSNLLYMLVSSNNFMKVANISSGSKMPRADWNLVSDSDFYIPKEMDEQKTIADYFKSLDSMIQGVTKKITSLKQMKQACLVSMFPQAGETTPRVRFKGFKGEWNCSPLSTFSKKVINKNNNLEIKITLTNSAEYGIINQLDFFDHDVSNGDNIRGYYVVENDDFVYNPRVSTLAPVGPINRNQLGYAGVMSPLYYVFRVSGIDKDYLSCFFKTNLWHKFMKDNGNSGARFDRLSITDDMFVQMPILYPKNEDEQQQIASFFTSLDKQISLQEARLEKLKQIKAACLDKMFV